MFKTLLAAAAISIATLASAVSAQAQTVKVLILQDDYDPDSLIANSRIQRAILNTWQQTMHAPAVLDQLSGYGIQGMDVYDESIFLDVFSKDPTQRRSTPQLIRTAELSSNPPIDVLVLYTVYTRAVTDPYTKVVKLLMSLTYRAIDVKSKRVFGGDNLDVAPGGVPVSGCAAHLNGVPPDPHCLLELVSTFGERLARDAGNAMALRLAALIGPTYGTAHAGGAAHDGAAGVAGDGIGAPAADGSIGGDVVGAVTPGPEFCPNIPTTFLITFEGFTPAQMTFLENNLAQWKCALDLDAVDHSLTNATYEYKTKANAGQAMRSIRFIVEQLNVNADIRPQSGNEVLVRAFGLRSN